jgi:hypothetical protein
MLSLTMGKEDGKERIVAGVGELCRKALRHTVCRYHALL